MNDAGTLIATGVMIAALCVLLLAQEGGWTALAWLCRAVATVSLGYILNYWSILLTLLPF